MGSRKKTVAEWRSERDAHVLEILTLRTNLAAQREVIEALRSDCAGWDRACAEYREDLRQGGVAREAAEARLESGRQSLIIAIARATAEHAEVKRLRLELSLLREAREATAGLAAHWKGRVESIIRELEASRG